MLAASIAIDAIKMSDDPRNRFSKFVERYREDLISQAFVILGNQDDAEDVAQETVSQACADLEHLRDSSKLRLWLRQINHNRAMDLLRRKKREREERLATGQMNSLVAPRTTTRASRAVKPADRITRAVDGLPAEFREVVVLRHFERLSVDEIARRLGIPAGTVYTRLARANRKLAEKLRLSMDREDHPK